MAAFNPDDLPWGRPLPPRRNPYIKLVSPTPYQPVSGIILSPGLHTIPTHFFDGRTTPCKGSELLCEACKAGVEPRFGAYLAIIVPPRGTLQLASVTAQAIRGCAPLADPSRNLRGWRLRLARKGKSARSPVVAEVTEGREDSSLPQEFDVRQVLLTIWGFVPKRGGKKSNGGKQRDSNGPELPID